MLMEVQVQLRPEAEGGGGGEGGKRGGGTRADRVAARQRRVTTLLMNVASIVERADEGILPAVRGVRGVRGFFLLLGRWWAGVGVVVCQGYCEGVCLFEVCEDGGGGADSELSLACATARLTAPWTLSLGTWAPLAAPLTVPPPRGTWASLAVPLTVPLTIPPPTLQVYYFIGRSLNASLSDLGMLTLARALVQALASPLSGGCGGGWAWGSRWEWVSEGRG